MRALALAGLLALATPASAQLVQDRPVITLAGARTITDAAQAEAEKRGLKVTIVVVDTGGVPVALRRMDGATQASPDIATGKAQTSARLGNPTALFEQRLQKEGQLRYLTFPGAMVATEGGLPVRANGSIVGAVGVSGATSQEDGLIAAAGVAAFEAGLAAKK